MVSLAKKNEKKPFHFIASHVQSADKDTVVDFVKSQKVDADSSNFSLTSQTRSEGMTQGGIPNFGVFDHTGKLVYEGRSSSEVDAIVAKLLKETPSFYLGQFNYTTDVLSIAQSLQERANVGKNLAKLEKIIASSMPEDGTEPAPIDSPEINEARDLTERVVSKFNAYKESAVEYLSVNPAKGLNELKALSKELKGSSFGKEIDNLYKQKKADPIIKASIPVGKKFNSFKMQYEKLLKEGKIPEKKQGAANDLKKKIGKLIDKHSDLPIADAMKDFIDSME